MIYVGLIDHFRTIRCSCDYTISSERTQLSENMIFCRTPTHWPEISSDRKNAILSNTYRTDYSVVRQTRFRTTWRLTLLVGHPPTDLKFHLFENMLFCRTPTGPTTQLHDKTRYRTTWRLTLLVGHPLNWNFIFPKVCYFVGHLQDRPLSCTTN